MSAPDLYGMAGEFLNPADVLGAAQAAYQRGYRAMDAYVPFSVDGLPEALGQRKTAVPLITLLCGITGGLAGYGMQLYSAALDYPLNVGGRPLHSWPMFVPIAFELTVLFAALGGVVGMLILNGLPRPHHPIFDTPFFDARSIERFYLCIEASDPLFDPDEVRLFFEKRKPANIWEVPK